MWSRAFRSQNKTDPKFAEYIKISDEYKHALESYWATLLHQLETGHYEPLLEEPFMRCMKELPWWAQLVGNMFTNGRMKGP